ncbi:hypothetical protein [Herminiimonas sp. CN]|uniref:hypothetical protein n=1 Tax=Herminiimonas sp. CN TaxID=1349818 RepID=UPI0012DE5099|nr:hypothetical protein [Herminiimonas sp. CN]
MPLPHRGMTMGRGHDAHSACTGEKRAPTQKLPATEPFDAFRSPLNNPDFTPQRRPCIFEALSPAPEGTKLCILGILLHQLKSTSWATDFPR